MRAIALKLAIDQVGTASDDEVTGWVFRSRLWQRWLSRTPWFDAVGVDFSRNPMLIGGYTLEQLKDIAAAAVPLAEEET